MLYPQQLTITPRIELLRQPWRLMASRYRLYRTSHYQIYPRRRPSGLWLPRLPALRELEATLALKWCAVLGLTVFVHDSLVAEDFSNSVTATGAG